MNPNYFYKITFKRKKPNLGNHSDLLLNLASPTYTLGNGGEINALSLILDKEGYYSAPTDNEVNGVVEFQGFAIYQDDGRKLKSTYVPWICNDGETEHLEIVYFADLDKGVFIKSSHNGKQILKKVLDSDKYFIKLKL